MEKEVEQYKYFQADDPTIKTKAMLKYKYNIQSLILLA